MKNKDICIISLPSYPLFDPKIKEATGGAEIDLFLIGKYLSLEKSISVNFVVADFGQKKIETFNDIKVYKTDTQNSGVIQRIISLIKFWKLLKQINADSYIQACADALTGITYLFCLLNKKKFVYRTTHVCDVNGDYVNKNPIAGWFYELGLKNASLILASVKAHKDILINLYGTKIQSKVVYIPNALEMNKLKTPEEKKYILWVARGTYWKQPELFVKLAEKYSEEEFLMIMSKQNNELNTFNQIKKQVDECKNLKFIGGVSFDELQPYFNKAKIFINTSIDEGFTITLIQSCIGRTPMIYLNVNPDEVITKYNIGYCADGNFEKMVDQVNVFLHNEKDWQEKSENAFRYVKENHDINIVGEQWKKLLEKI